MQINTPSKSRFRRNTLKGWVLFFPSLVFFSLFTFYPFINTFVLSFYKKKLAYKDAIFNGVQNYTRAFADAVLSKSINNTLTFCLIVIPASLILGLMLAYLLNKQTPGRTLFRAMVFYPNISPMVGFYLVWMYLLASDIGYINRLFSMINLPTRNWLWDSRTVLHTLAVVYIWRQAGYMMLFFLSGLQSIDESYYEAATLDGASERQKFTKITFPLLMPTVVYTTTLSITSSVQLIDPIAILTSGGPNNSSSMVMYYIYKKAFTDFDYGMAATYSVLLLVTLLIVIAVQYFGMDRLTHYES